MDKIINEVHLTDEYGKFKKLKGNRTVDSMRIAKIRESVKKIGFVNGPIIVNENFEVIDGQGRLEVCRTDNVPVPYIVIDGIGVEECISMNINQSNWKTTDYIKAYADLERPDYVRFQAYLNANYMRPNGMHHNLSTLHWAAFHTGLGNNDLNIRDGNLVFTCEDRNRANEMLDFFDEFKGVLTNRKTEFFCALGYCTFFEEVDKYRLVKTVTSAKPGTFMTISTIRDAICAIENVYNYRARQLAHIDAAYLDYLKTVTKTGAAYEACEKKRAEGAK